MKKQQEVKGAFLGLAIGDALGVPVEFVNRRSLKGNPVKDYREGGLWDQPAGTFSDDSSMAFCLAESLCRGYDPEDMGRLFVRWYEEGYWGAHNECFDIGITTRKALGRIEEGTPAVQAGGFGESENGNGSLMRILPLVFYLQGIDHPLERYQKVKEVSSITHAHFRSVFACFIYCEFALELLKEKGKEEAFQDAINTVNKFVKSQSLNSGEVGLFKRVLDGSLLMAREEEIESEGYVLHTLEAGIWCLFTSESYEEAVLKAVNLGGDTDTTGAVTGGLAGILYGYESIPEEWIKGLAKRQDIVGLALRLAENL